MAAEQFRSLNEPQDTVREERRVTARGQAVAEVRQFPGEGGRRDPVVERK